MVKTFLSVASWHPLKWRLQNHGHSFRIAIQLQRRVVKNPASGNIDRLAKDTIKIANMKAKSATSLHPTVKGPWVQRRWGNTIVFSPSSKESCSLFFPSRHFCVSVVGGEEMPVKHNLYFMTRNAERMIPGVVRWGNINRNGYQSSHQQQNSPLNIQPYINPYINLFINCNSHQGSYWLLSLTIKLTKPHIKLINFHSSSPKHRSWKWHCSQHSR